MSERISNARLLVVDDNEGNQYLLRRHLDHHGYSAETANDGREALEKLASGDFDLVLLDVIMPGLDGVEVLRQMKADPSLRDIPVIIMSALDENSSVISCIKMGAEDYLNKPFDPVLLNARIGASLEKKHLRDEERKRAEELQQALEQLRRTQDQLLVQENLASLGALTAGIAHEIRNPLNFVTNFATAAREILEEMRQAPTPPPGLMNQLDEYLQKIDEHGKRADRIVRSMLMHSRGKSGEHEQVDLRNLLFDCVNLAYHALRAQEREFNARIELAIDNKLATVRAVPQDINRVFLNILNNAFYAVWERKKKEGESYHPAVGVRASNLGDGVEVRVKDNGPGIPADVLPKIFNPFFTTKPAGGGTGLGLSLSHEIIVRGHRGTIRAESGEGTGTEFIVTLPAGTT